MPPRAISLDAGRCEVAGPHGRALLRPTPFRLLAYLARHRDRYVSAAELHQEVWHTSAVSDAALSTAIRDIRRALGDDPRDPRYVSTRRRVGYRFVGATTEPDEEALERLRLVALLDRALSLARADRDLVRLLEQVRDGLVK